ncbi:hypothetical protein IIA16_02185 [bacterium]|nr:hypothetical protein [bacterium]
MANKNDVALAKEQNRREMWKTIRHYKPVALWLVIGTAAVNTADKLAGLTTIAEFSAALSTTPTGTKWWLGFFVASFVANLILGAIVLGLRDSLKRLAAKMALARPVNDD